MAYSFRGLAARKHVSIQADMVLEKELRVLHLDQQAAESDWLELLRPQYLPHSDTLPPRPHLIVPLPGMSIYKLSCSGTHRLVQTHESVGAVTKHGIMQNTFSPNSKAPTVYSSLNNVKSPKFEVPSEIHPIA